VAVAVHQLLMSVLEPAQQADNHRVYMMQDMREAMVEVILLVKAMAVAVVRLVMPVQVVMVELMAHQDPLAQAVAVAAEGHTRHKEGQWVDVLDYSVKVQMEPVARQVKKAYQAVTGKH
jgi:hypothetical protein